MKYSKLKYFNSKPSVILISIFFLISPFIFDYRISDSISSIRFLAISFILVLLSLIRFKNKFNLNLIKHPIFICLTFFLIINITSSFVNGLSADSLFSNYRVCLFLLLTYFFANIFNNLKILILAKSVLLFSLLLLIVYFLQLFDAINNDVYIQSVDKISSTLGNKNLLASALVLTIPFIFYVFEFSLRYWKVFSVIVLNLMILCLFIVQSKVCIVAFIVIVLSFYFFSYSTYKKSLFYLLLSFSTIASVLFYVSPYTLNHLQSEFDQLVRMKNRVLEDRVVQNDSRYLLYKKTFEMIKSKPFIGIGPGNWKRDISKYGLKNTLGQKGDKFVQRPHSDFLWFFSESGFFSFASYLIYFFLLLLYSFNLFRNKKNKFNFFYLSIFSTILGYFIISCFDFPSERPLHNFLLSIITAIVISGSIKNNNVFKFRSMIFSSSLSFLCVLIFAYSILIYKSNLHMSDVLKYKSQNNWNQMIVKLNSAYHPLFYDVDNTSTPLFWYYGIAYFNMGDIKQAFNYFKKAYKKNQYHLHVVNNLATCYGYFNKYKEAENLYKECQIISPRFEEAALNLANIYFYNNKEEQALDLLLAVRDFRIESFTDLTDVYLEYFNKIFNKIYINQKNSNDSFYIFTKSKSSFKKIKELNKMRNNNFHNNEILKKLI